MLWRKSLTDEHVIRRVLSGRRDEFGLLVERYLPMVHALAFAQLGNHADAEDAAQEAFLKAFKSLAGLKSRAKFRSWLTTITRTVCANVQHADRRRAAVAQRAPFDRVSVPEVERRELHDLLRRQILELDEGPREVLLLRYFAEMKLREIAAALDITPAAAAKRIERARQTLGKRLVEQLGPAFEQYKPTRERAAKIIGVIATTPIPWEAVPQGTLATLAGTTILGGAVTVKHICIGMAVVACGLLGSWRADQHLTPSLSASPYDSNTVAGPDANADSTFLSDPATGGTSSVRLSQLDQAASSVSLQDGGGISGRIVDRDSGNPVADITFTLESAYHHIQLNATTGPDGTFHIAAAREDEYRLVVDDDIWVDPGTNLSFVVLEGETVKGLRFEVARGGVITGRIFDHETDEPVAGARVSVEQERAGERVVVRDGLSRSSGEYIITGLPEGAYLVRVTESPGYAELRGDELEHISVRLAEQAEGVNFALYRSPKVFGHVVDWEGRPVHDAEVIAWPNRTHRDDPMKLTAWSADDGSFEIVGLHPKNTFSLEVKKADLVHKSLSFSSPFDVGRDGMLIAMYPPASVAGRVVDAFGRSMSDAKVKFRWKSPKSNGSLVPAKTDSWGYFEKGGLLFGMYELKASPENAEAGVPVRIELEYGERVADVIVVWDPGGGLTISGRVTDTYGRPMANARIFCNGPTSATADTDKSGYYVVGGLLQGSYSMTVDHGEHRYLEGYPAEAGAQSVDFVLEPRRTGRIAGRVVCADTGEPVTKFRFFVNKGVHNLIDLLETGWESSFRKVSHPDGRFDARAYDVGEYTVLVCAAGYAPNLQVVVAPADEVTFRLEPGARVEGVVLDPTGNPVVGAQIVLGPIRAHAAPNPGGARVLGWSRSDGTFRIDDLSPAPQTISAHDKNYGAGSADVVPSVSDVTTITIQLTSVGLLEGMVLFDGEVVDDMKDATIRVIYENGDRGYVGLLPVREDGTYQVSRQRPGMATVTVRLDPYKRGRYPRWSMTKTAIIGNEMVTPVDFHFPTGDALLTGVVLTNGQFPQRAFLRIVYPMDDGELSLKAEADSDGLYRVEGLPAGSATVHVFATSPSGERYEQIVELTVGGGSVIERDIDLGVTE